jgi:hypothetical protein
MQAQEAAAGIVARNIADSYAELAQSGLGLCDRGHPMSSGVPGRRLGHGAQMRHLLIEMRADTSGE